MRNLRAVAVGLLVLGVALVGCFGGTKSAVLDVLEVPAPTEVKVALRNTGSSAFTSTYNGFLQGSVINSTVYHPIIPGNETAAAAAFPTAVRVAPGEAAVGWIFFSGSVFPFRLVYAFDNIELEVTVENVTRAR